MLELCAQLPDNADFNPTRDYNQMSDPANLKTAITTALGKGKTADSYVNNPAKPTKRRSFQLSNVSTDMITNHDRVQFAKAYKNAYKVSVDGTIKTYTNSTYLMKATAYLIKDGNVTLSNSVYICLKDESKKDLAVGNMPVESSSSEQSQDP